MLEDMNKKFVLNFTSCLLYITISVMILCGSIGLLLGLICILTYGLCIYNIFHSIRVINLESRTGTKIVAPILAVVGSSLYLILGINLCVPAFLLNLAAAGIYYLEVNK